MQRALYVLLLALVGCDIKPHPIVKWTPDKVTIDCVDGWIVQADTSKPHADDSREWARAVVESAICRKALPSERPFEGHALTIEIEDE